MSGVAIRGAATGAAPGLPAAPGLSGRSPAKHGQALQAAGKKKAGAEELCKLFKAFLAAESKMIKGLEEHSATCGVPARCDQAGEDLARQGVRRSASRICEAAAQGPRPAGPSLSDALGTTPMVPDSTGPKRGAGTFDTLEGSPLAR